MAPGPAEVLAEWQPAPPPKRQSPYYTLRSVAFHGTFDDDGNRSKIPNVVMRPGAGGCPMMADTVIRPQSRTGTAITVLPPVKSFTSVRSVLENSMVSKANIPRKQKINDQKNLAEDLILEQPKTQLSAALADYQRVNNQLKANATRLDKELRRRFEAEQRTQAFREQAVQMKAILQTELKRAIEQQYVLRLLRTKVRQGQGFSVRVFPSATASTLVQETDRTQSAPSSIDLHDATDCEGNSSSGVSAACVETPPEAATLGCYPERPDQHKPELIIMKAEVQDVDRTLARLLSEIPQMKESLCGAGKACKATTSDPTLHGQSARFSNDRKTPEVVVSTWPDDDDAEIEVIRNEGVPMACMRLRHPCCVEASVNLRTGHLISWHHVSSQGDFVYEKCVPLMWPSILEQSNFEASTSEDQEFLRPWRLTQLDDSNNEPSVTLSCGGDGTSWPWHVRRTLTLGAGFLRDSIYVENLLDCCGCSDASPTAITVWHGVMSDSEVSGLAVAIGPGKHWSACKTWLGPDRLREQHLEVSH